MAWTGMGASAVSLYKGHKLPCAVLGDKIQDGHKNTRECPKEGYIDGEGSKVQDV